MSCIQYIEGCINSNVRIDGRTLAAYRYLEVNNNVLMSADGSSSVINDENNVICGIKLSLVAPEKENEDEGTINLEIDCPANINKNKIKEQYIQTITSIIYNMCIEDKIDKKKLCVLPSKFVWNVDINVMVLSAGGSLLDVISLAIYVALKNTIIPIVQPQKIIEESIVYNNMKRKEYNIKVLEDKYSKFPCENVPICISIGEFNNKYIYDMSLIEEEIVENILVVAITPYGKCVSFHMLHGISMEISSVLHITENAIKVALEIFEKIHATLKQIQEKAKHYCK